MYKNVLVPVSFEEDRDTAGAINVARVLAGDGGKVTVLHVMEQIPGYAISYVPENYLVESRQAIEAELSEMAATLPNGGAEVIDVDCIVIASHRPGMQDLLLGSTATQVVRHAGCAVHVIR